MKTTIEASGLGESCKEREIDTYIYHDILTGKAILEVNPKDLLNRTVAPDIKTNKTARDRQPTFWEKFFGIY